MGCSRHSNSILIESMRSWTMDIWAKRGNKKKNLKFNFHSDLSTYICFPGRHFVFPRELRNQYSECLNEAAVLMNNTVRDNSNVAGKEHFTADMH